MNSTRQSRESNVGIVAMQPSSGFDVCQYFGFLFASYCAVVAPPQEALLGERYVQRSAGSAFASAFEWATVNFTWPAGSSASADAIASGAYVPEHNAPVAVRFYKSRMYVALARLRPGTPVTLASVPLPPAAGEQALRDLLLEPFPSWTMNAGTSCATLQNVHSFEIDRRGMMWVLDGTRINDLSHNCPPKLVIIDLNNGARVTHRHTFAPEVTRATGGFLNDLVVDEADGGYAYITDHSIADPGLVVFARRQRRAWKLRDRSMFAEVDATNFTVDGVRFSALAPIDGIALSPPAHANTAATFASERVVYYTALSGFHLYALSTRVLRDEHLAAGGEWRAYVKHVGRRPAIADGLLIDSAGFLYYGLIQSYAIGRWNIYERFSTAKEILRSRRDVVWPDSFAMDEDGYLYVLCNAIHKYFDATHPLVRSDDVKFRVLRLFTGNRNYMYSP